MDHRLCLIRCTTSRESETKAANVRCSGRDVDVERDEAAVDIHAERLRLEEEEVANVCEEIDEGIGMWDAVPVLRECLL